MSSPEAKAAFRKFVPSSERVHGVRLPQLNELAKTYTHFGLPLVRQLWSHGAFEEKLLAAKILGPVGRKDPSNAFTFLQNAVVDVRDWAVCDTLATQGVRGLLAAKKEEILLLAARLIASSNLWERRFGVVLLTNFAKEKDLHGRLSAMVKPLEREAEHSVKKALQWLARDLVKAGRAARSARKQ